MRCSRPCRATLAMVAIGCALAACGSAEEHIKSRGSPGAISLNAAGLASYRAALTWAIDALGSDTGQYITACVQPVSSSVGRCKQWVSSDEGLIGRQVLGLSKATVPAALARADKRLHQIINQIYAADIALARAIAADKANGRAVQAAIWGVSSAPRHLQEALDQLDPGLTSMRMQ